MMKLTDKIAIITGAGRDGKGIGRSIARAMAAEGARVAVASRTEANALAVAQELRDEGYEALGLACDVADAASVDAMVKTVIEAWGRIDVLVNNAGITRDGLVLRMKEEDWDAVIDTNLKGTFLCCKAVLRVMVRQKSGRIINMSSVMGQMGAAGQVNYSAAKGAIITFTRSLAKEVASRGILVNAISPGFIETVMTQEVSEEVRQWYLQHIPQQRYGSPEEVARVAVFLASDDASYITGHVINVDGGLIMQTLI
jgi:3-oxoacyl-[acyl-carrier protein] reductase